MTDAKRKELSGAFSSSEKWADVLGSLRQDDCLVETLQVMHNKTQHNILAAAALFFNRSVTHVEWGDLDPVGARCLSMVLQAGSGLRALKVQRLNNVDAAVAELVPGLRATNSLEELQLSWAGQESLLAAAAAVRAPFSALTHLTITRSSLHPDVADCFAKAYAQGSGALQEMNMSDCTVLGNGLQILLSSLEAHTGVVRLSITSSGVAASHLLALAECPSLCQRLTHLCLSGNSLGNAGMNCLAKALARNCSLVKLVLERSGLDDSCAQDIAGCVQNCQALQVLLLAENEIADATLESLAAEVSRHCSLRELDMSQNKIGGIQSLGWLVSETSPLKCLKLCKNWRIGDEGAIALAERLQHNMGMVALHLSECGIKCDGAKALAGPVKLHPALIALHLDGCRIGDSGACELMNSVRANLNLRCWNMDNNRVRDKMTRKMLSDFSAAVSKRTDESVHKRRCLQMHQHGSPTSSQLASPRNRSPITPAQASPSTPCPIHNSSASPVLQPAASPRPHHSHHQHHPQHSSSPADSLPMFTPAPARLCDWSPPDNQQATQAQDGDLQAASTMDTKFPSVLTLWKNVANTMNSIGSLPERIGSISDKGSPPASERLVGSTPERDTAPRSLFQGMGPSLKKIDSFGRWMSGGSTTLKSVDSLTAWGSYLPGALSRPGSVALSRPVHHQQRTNRRDKDVNADENEDGNEDDEEDVCMDEDDISFIAVSNKDETPEEAESPRYIGAFGSFARTLAKAGSFKFFEFMRTSSESGGTPSFRTKSPIGSPVVSPSAAKAASRLSEVTE